jgi:hypothetical protein
MPVLTAIDLLGIQDYVFASNRLRDAVGSSAIVKEACDGEGLLSRCGIAPDEILLAAGGNVVLRTGDVDRARALAGRYTRELFDSARGLEAAVVHYEESGGLAASMDALFSKAARSKPARVPSVPIAGLGVTALCRETSLPANVVDPATRAPVSRRIALARDQRRRALKRWQTAISGNNSLAGWTLEFPLELDHLGRSRGDTSLVGIVHVDGNSVGKTIRGWLETVKDQPDGTVEQQYRQLAGGLDALGMAAFDQVLGRVLGALGTDQNGKPSLAGMPEDLGFPLFSEDNSVYAPLVPILLGGDDLTFVCDGRIALALAEAALDAFRRAAPIPNLGKIGACVGVAIVHAHAPFFRAYQLAEELCRSAKESVRDQECAFALDWQIGLGRPDEPLTRRREREYHADGRSLTARPYHLDGGDQSWEWLSGGVLQDFRNEWSSRRNKVQSLRSIARGGPVALERQIGAWRVLDASLKFPGGIGDGGFTGDPPRTALIDAVELLDIHLVPNAAQKES